MKRIDDASPRLKARIVGGVYLLFFLTAVVGVGISGGFTSTPSYIVAHETSFRLGFALSLISTACYVALAALFYNLFKHVNRTVALIAAFLSLVGSAVTAFGGVFQLAPLVVMGGSQYSSAFSVQQLRALSQLFLDMSTQVGYIDTVFFGLFNLAISYLIFRSTFLPRILAGLMALSGLGWLTFLSPPLATRLLTPIEVLGFLAEAALMLWLLLVGVNSQRWNEQAGLVGAPVRA